MRPCVILGCVLIIIASTVPIIMFESAGAESNGYLTEGIYWTYQMTRRSESIGTGTYEGQATFIENTKGRVTVKKLNATMLVIEDLREINQSSSGSGFFKQNMNAQTTLTIISSIDRRTLRVMSRETRGDPMSDEYVYDSTKGAPTAYFVSTSLKRGQDAQYYWGGQVINCFVDEGAVSLHGINISAITLRYSGPKKVSIQTVTRFPEDGNAEATFYFEKTAGLLVLYTAREKAKTKSGACCAVTTTNTENYTIQSTSFWESAKSPQAPTSSPSSSSTPTSEVTPPQALTEILSRENIVSTKQNLILVSVAAVILIGLSHLIMRRKGGVSRSSEE